MSIGDGPSLFMSGMTYLPTYLPERGSTQSRELVSSTGFWGQK